MTHVAEKGVVI